MKNKKLITIFIFILSIVFTYTYIVKTINFRFVLQNRSSIYLRVDDRNVLNGDKKDEVKNFMYCENIVEENNGLKCGFYINGIKFSIGK